MTIMWTASFKGNKRVYVFLVGAYAVVFRPGAAIPEPFLLLGALLKTPFPSSFLYDRTVMRDA